jgi:hypothetical protein
VIPRADIELWLDDPELAAGLPETREEVEAAGFADGNWEYEPAYARSTWEDAAEALEVEAGLIESADRCATTPEEFDSLIDGELEDWQLMALGGIEAGVAAAVYALNAAGCVTTTSCRGHPGRFASAGRDVPRVRFMTDVPRARLVRAAAEWAGCAFGVEPPIAEIFAPSVSEMNTFAARLLADQDQFSALPGRGCSEEPLSD